MEEQLFYLFSLLFNGAKKLVLSEFASTVFIATVTAFAGAFAGGYSAQRIAERLKIKDELIREIRHTNAAITAAFSICNSFLSLKKQHIKNLAQTYYDQKSTVEKINEQKKTGQPASSTFEFVADFQTIPPMNVPIDRLQSLVYDDISVIGRSLHLTSTLNETIQSLNRSIQERNNFIENYKLSGGLPDDALARIYFGLPDNEGNIDNNYPMYIDAINKLTDDCIQFGLFIVEDLATHGEHLKGNYIKKFRGEKPKIGKPDFSIAEEQCLLPDKSLYMDWDNMFSKGEGSS